MDGNGAVVADVSDDQVSFTDWHAASKPEWTLHLRWRDTSYPEPCPREPFAGRADPRLPVSGLARKPGLPHRAGRASSGSLRHGQARGHPRHTVLHAWLQ